MQINKLHLDRLRFNSLNHWYLSLLAVLILSTLWACDGGAGPSSATESPTSEIVAKLHENMSVPCIVDGLMSARNDSDLIMLSRYITEENAPILCQKFYMADDDSIKKIRVSSQYYQLSSVAEYVVKNERFNWNAKNCFIVDLVSKLKKEPHNHQETITQITEYLFFLHNTYPHKIKEALSHEQLLELIPSECLFDVMVEFEELSRQHSKRNFTLRESWGSPRGLHRPGTHWPMTLMQSIVNFEPYSDDVKRSSLRIILSKAIEESHKRNTAEKTEEYVRNANLCIDRLVFDEKCEVNALDIFVYDLLGCHTKYDGDLYKDRKRILEWFHKKNKWAKYTVS